MEKLIGFLLPPAIDLINRRVKNSDARFWVSVFVCVVVGLAIDYFSGGIESFESAANLIMWTFGLSQLSYKGIYGGSSLQERIR